MQEHARTNSPMHTSSIASRACVRAYLKCSLCEQKWGLRVYVSTSWMLPNWISNWENASSILSGPVHFSSTSTSLVRSSTIHLNYQHLDCFLPRGFELLFNMDGPDYLNQSPLYCCFLPSTHIQTHKLYSHKCKVIMNTTEDTDTKRTIGVLILFVKLS